MGLDNIPYVYPCIAKGLQDPDEEIDCEKIVRENKCPWNEAMGEMKGGIYGMFGTHCWYRGKSGNYMLEKLKSNGYSPPIGKDGEPLSFYGDWADGDDEIVSPEACIELAEWMADHAEAYASISGREYPLEEEIDSYRYAISWLKFVSEYGGSRIWY